MEVLVRRRLKPLPSSKNLNTIVNRKVFRRSHRRVLGQLIRMKVGAESLEYDMGTGHHYREIMHPSARVSPYIPTNLCSEFLSSRSLSWGIQRIWIDCIRTFHRSTLPFLTVLESCPKRPSLCFSSLGWLPFFVNGGLCEVSVRIFILCGATRESSPTFHKRFTSAVLAATQGKGGIFRISPRYFRTLSAQESAGVLPESSVNSGCSGAWYGSSIPVIP